MVSLPFGKKPDSGEGKSNGHRHSNDEAEKEEHDSCRKRILVLKKIIERYRLQIELGETKSVQDLRNLIDPKNAAIQQIRGRIASGFRPYIYEEHFPEAASLAFKFLKNDIGNEALPVDFWLYPEDVLELGVADEMDKAIFLCSLLMALDNETSRVFVETSGNRHAFVMFEFNNKTHLMDPVHDFNVSGEKEELLRTHIGENYKKVIYSFDNKQYYPEEDEE